MKIFYKKQGTWISTLMVICSCLIALPTRSMQPDPVAAEQKIAQSAPSAVEPEKKQAEEKSLYQTALEHPVKLGVAALTATLIATGVLYWKTGGTAFAQSQNDVMPARGINVLGSLGSIGSSFFSSIQGVGEIFYATIHSIGYWISYGHWPSISGMRSHHFLFGSNVRLSAYSRSLLFIMGGLVIADVAIVAENTLFGLYQQYREYHYPELRQKTREKIATETEKLRSQIATLQSNANTLLEQAVTKGDPSKILDQNNWQTAQELVADFNTIQEESWKLDAKSTVLLLELILLGIQPITKIEILTQVFNPRMRSTPGGFDPKVWGDVLANLVRLVKEKIKLLNEQIKLSEDQAWRQKDFEHKYGNYFHVSMYIAQIEEAQKIIEHIVQSIDQVKQTQAVTEYQQTTEAIKKTLGEAKEARKHMVAILVMDNILPKKSE